MDSTRDRIHKLRTGKACQSCRRRKVRCEINGRTSRCRACERRMSPCSMASPSGLGPLMEQIPRRSGIEEQDLAFPARLDADSWPIDSDVSSLPCPWLPPQDLGDALPFSISDPDPSTAIPDQLPLLQYFESLFNQPADGTDPLSSLLCFALPRSLVGQPGSSPFSIFSLEGKQWLHNAVGEEFFDWDLLSPSPFGSDLPPTSSFRRPYIPLPAKDAARCLFKSYFKKFNTFCPAFDEPDFMLRFERHYPMEPHDTEMWAFLNAVLALACLLDRTSYTDSWLYWKNATLSWESFFSNAPSLMSAQALVAMILYLISTFHSHPSNTMVSLAIRTLRGLAATHESVSQQFTMVLMITRTLDIDHALLAGTPPTDPEPDEYRSLPFMSVLVSSPSFDCYETFCRLTSLKRSIYRELYSVSAEDKSNAEVIATVSSLDARLEEWKESIPEEFRPDHPKCNESMKRGMSLLIVHLHLAYHNSILTIHRRTIPCTEWSLHLEPLLSSNRAIRPSNPRFLVSAKLCAGAARSSMRLVKHIPRDNALICGIMSQYILFALKLFTILIVQDPWSSRLTADIGLLRKMEDFLSSICIDGADQSIPKLIAYCARYRELAEKAVEHVLVSMRGRGGNGLRTV
ncbi:hypothetical protein BJX99DRAFT_224571 [Aspergillus californicus]